MHIPCLRGSGIALSALAVIAIVDVGAASSANATSWYVDGLKGSLGNNGVESAPYLYLWQALKVVQPGDTIFMVPSKTYPYQGFTANGTASAPITLSGLSASNLTHVSGGGLNTGIWINGNYLVVKNFDVTAPGAFVAIGLSANHHHVTIDSNVIHDAGGNGINTIANDYITISHNVVYGNAKNTSQAFGSGISLLGSVDIDSFTGTKMVVDSNFVYNNTNVPNCSTSACYAAASDSDGSGIILDDNQRQRFDNVRYRGSFRVSNNVIYGNGGRGVHVYRSDNATITDNTMYENNTDPYESFWHPGELSAVQSGHITAYNNILYSSGGSHKNPTGTAVNSNVMVSFESCSDGMGPMIVSHNLGYNPQNDGSLFYYGQQNTNSVSVTSNSFLGTKLENPNGGDFRPGPGSPAYGTGDAATSVATDILGVSRSPKPSIGAYQNTGP